MDMAKMYDAEIANYLKIIEAKEKRIEVLKLTCRKALKMM